MRKITTIILLTALVGSSAAQTRTDIYHDGWIDFNKNGEKDIYEDPKQPIEKRINNLLQQMTFEEKTCQLATLYGYGAVSPDSLPTPAWKTSIWKDGIGNVDEQLNGEWKRTLWEYPYSNHPVAMNKVQAFFVEKNDIEIGIY